MLSFSATQACNRPELVLHWDENDYSNFRNCHLQCSSCLFICNGLGFRVTLFSSHSRSCIACIHTYIRYKNFGLLQIYECFFSLENVYLRRLRGLAKVLGTIVTVGGAMFMTLINGPMLNLPWTHGNGHQESTSAANNQDVIKGALMMLAGWVYWSAFIILQVRVLSALI